MVGQRPPKRGHDQTGSDPPNTASEDKASSLLTSFLHGLMIYMTAWSNCHRPRAQQVALRCGALVDFSLQDRSTSWLVMVCMLLLSERRCIKGRRIKPQQPHAVEATFRS